MVASIEHMRTVFLATIFFIIGCSNRYSDIGKGYILQHGKENDYIISIKDYRGYFENEGIDIILDKVIKAANSEISFEFLFEKTGSEPDELSLSKELIEDTIPNKFFFTYENKPTVEIVIVNSTKFLYVEKIDSDYPRFRFYFSRKECIESKSNTACMYKIVRAVYHELSHYYNDSKLKTLIQQEFYASSVELCAIFNTKAFNTYTFSDSVINGHKNYESILEKGSDDLVKLKYWKVSSIGQYKAERKLFKFLGQKRAINKKEYSKAINNYCAPFFISNSNITSE